MDLLDKDLTSTGAGGATPAGDAQARGGRESPESGARRERKRWLSQERIVVALTLATFLVFAVTVPGFPSIGNVLVLARGVAILGILGVGMALVVIGRGMDLSQAALFAVSSAWSVHLMRQGVSMPAALAAGFGAALVAGTLNGVLIAFIEMPPLIATLALGILI
jgi:ribose transport system permease protein